jgi:hypothetical protein
MLAGIAGVDPGPHTLRELKWMAEGVERTQWHRCSVVATTLINLKRDPKHKPIPSDAYSPYAEYVRPEPIVVPKKRQFEILKRVFIDSRQRN